MQFVLLLLSLLVAPLSAHASVAATYVGYPPPGTLTFISDAGGPDGSAPYMAGPPSNPNGVTWSYLNVQLATWAKTWWGPQANQIFEFTSTPFVYLTTTAVTPTTATVIYQGPGGGGYSQRFIMKYNSQQLGGCPMHPLVLATTASVGIADNGTIGVVAQVFPNTCLSVQMLFQVCSGGTCDPHLDGGWVPAINAFPAWSAIVNASGDFQFPTNFQGGFYDSNTAPTIQDLTSSNLVAQQNAASSAFPFTVGDAESDPSLLAVTATSDTQGVIANANIQLGGSGANRTVTVTAGATTGTAKLTIKVTDHFGLNSQTTLKVGVNQIPTLDTNSLLQTGQGTGAFITSSLLSGTDPDTGSPVIFVVTGQPHNGHLALNEVVDPPSFTQADINANKVSYTNNNACDTTDNFQFEVEDVDGGFAFDPGAPGPPPTIYNFGMKIVLTQTAPSAQGAVYAIALGGSVNNTLQASSTDCGPPAIAFQGNTLPQHGSLPNFDANTGAFTYIANLGYSGSDSFTFVATTYGNMPSAPATITINIQESAPTANSATLITHPNQAAIGTLTATDANLPPLSLGYAIATQPVNGTVILDDASTGAYTYVPKANQLGVDSFTFTANNGQLTSTPATISVEIRSYPKGGDLVITDEGNGDTIPPSVLVFDPVAGTQGIVSRDPSYTQLQGVAVQADGRIVVTNGSTVVRIDPIADTTTPLVTTGLVMPFGLAVESTGNLLITDPAQGVILRVNGSTGAPVSTVAAAIRPSGIVVASDGTIYYDDVSGLFAPGPNLVMHINSNGSNPQVVSSAGDLDSPVGLAVDGSSAYVSTLGAGGTNTNLLKLALAGGAQTLLAQNGLLKGSPGLALVGPTLYVTSKGDSSVVTVPVVGGPAANATIGGLLAAPWGIAVVPSTPGVDLAVSITNTHPFLPGGTTIQFTIQVQNFGAVGATGAQVTDSVPVEMTSESWTCVASPGASCTPNGNGSINDTVNVPAGGALTYTVTVHVAKLPELTTLYAVDVLPASGVVDINLNNNSATLTGSVKIFANGFEHP